MLSVGINKQSHIHFAASFQLTLVVLSGCRCPPSPPPCVYPLFFFSLSASQGIRSHTSHPRQQRRGHACHAATHALCDDNLGLQQCPHPRPLPQRRCAH